MDQYEQLKLSSIDELDELEEDDIELLETGDSNNKGNNSFFSVNLSKISLFSQFSFGWIQPLLKIGYRKPLEIEHIQRLYNINDEEVMNSSTISKRFERVWREELKRNK